MHQKPGRHLPIGAVFSEALDELLDRQREFARALLLPLLWLTVWSVVVAPALAALGPFGLVNLAVYFYFSVPIMVATYRLVLGEGDTGPDTDTWTLWPRWSAREVRVLGWLVAMGVGFCAVQLLFSFALSSVLLSGSMTKLLFSRGVAVLWWMMPVLSLVLMASFYVCSRLWILFPAASMDERRSLTWAWETTRGYGFSLFTLWLPLFVATWIFALAILYTLGATGWLPNVLSSALSSVGLVVQNVIVAVAYRRLAGAPRGGPSEVAFLEEYGLV